MYVECAPAAHEKTHNKVQSSSKDSPEAPAKDSEEAMYVIYGGPWLSPCVFPSQRAFIPVLFLFFFAARSICEIAS